MRLLECISGVVAVVSLLGAAVSCTVKEDRFECPSWVTLLPDGPLSQDMYESGGGLSVFVYRDGEQALQLGYTLPEFDAGVAFPVVKGPVELAGVIDWPAEYVDGDVLQIPYGKDCPEAWGFSDRLFLEEEEHVFYEHLKALFANVYVEIVGAPEDYPFTPVLEGTVDGYSLASLEPHRGDFLAVPRTVHYDLRFCRVPRQVDASLMFFLVEGFLMPTKVAGSVYDLPIGEVLEQEGYDWDADYLEDIHIYIDYARTKVTISVADWTKVLIMGGKYVI